MAKPSIADVYERVIKLEVCSKNQSDKFDEIHKALMGNGQPGLLADMNQWKGGVKLFGWVSGIAITMLGICVAAIAYIK